MDPLTGLNVTASGLLALGGALKVVRPRPAAEALGSLGIGIGPDGRRVFPTPLMRVIGGVELAVAAGALLIGGSMFFAVQTLCFVAFTVVAAALWRRGTVSSCGCFGEVTSPPSAAHVVVTAAGAVVSGRAALAGVRGLLDDPLSSLPALVAGLAALGLVYLCLVDLPRLADAVRLHRGANAT
jgi:hypothetical protein